MKTAFATGPGFYAAATAKSDNLIPTGTLRFYVARIEAYDGEAAQLAGNETQFKLLPAMCEGKPDVARALMQLRHHLNANAELIVREAKL